MVDSALQIFMAHTFGITQLVTPLKLLWAALVFAVAIYALARGIEALVARRWFTAAYLCAYFWSPHRWVERPLKWIYLALGIAMMWEIMRREYWMVYPKYRWGPIGLAMLFSGPAIAAAPAIYWMYPPSTFYAQLAGATACFTLLLGAGLWLWYLRASDASLRAVIVPMAWFGASALVGALVKEPGDGPYFTRWFVVGVCYCCVQLACLAGWP